MRHRLIIAIVLLFGLATAEESSSAEVTTNISNRRKGKQHTEAVQAVLKETLSFKDLPDLISTNETVMVLFNSADKGHAKYNKTLVSLYKYFAKQNIVFASIQMEDAGEENLKSIQIHLVPSFYIYISGNRKHYSGELKLQNLKIWIKEVTSAKPIRRKKMADIEDIDKHYFVYASPVAISKDKRKFEILAKLISPLSIYTGFPKKELEKLIAGRKIPSSVFIYREYKNQVVDIDQNKSLEEQGSYIVANEFPPNMVCDLSALRFIREFKIPVLAYFAQSDNDPNWEMIKEVGLEFKEYALTVLVKPRAKDRCSTFLRKFLNVSKTPALRVLSLAGKVKRHLFLGTLDQQHVKFFMSHYVSGNLKSYSINQKLAKNNELKGIKLANYSLFKQAMTDYNRTYLFYIYDGDVKTLNKDLRALNRLQEKLNQNKTFSIYAINHDHNDLDGFYNNSLPLVFLIAKKGKFVHFDEKKITTKGLLEFVISQVPYLKGITDRVETDL